MDPDVSATLFHETVDRREPEACPSALFLCREKGFEDVRLRLGVHAGTGIAHDQHHIFPGNRGPMPQGEFLIET